MDLARALVVVVVSGCVASSSVVCGDGRLCPAGTTCEETHQLCVVPEQRTACASLADRAACSYDITDGTCIDGLCLPTVCGDGVIEGTEQCEGSDLQGITGCLDLGYYQDGPVACTTDCELDRSQCHGICGDGVLDPAHEACDSPHDVVVAQCNDAAVGFYNPGDVRCNAACELDTSACTGTCGDGIINGSEVCDGAPPGVGCLGYGFDYGAIGCVRCGPDFSSCGSLGWQDEQLQLLTQASAIMGTSSTDYWVSGPSEAAHIVDHVATQYPFTGGDGQSLWLQGNEVFVAGGNTEVQHGVVAADGTTAFTAQSLPGTGIRFIHALSGVGTNDIYGAGSINTGANEIFHYDGAVWTAAFAGPNADVVGAFWAAGPNEMWLATSALGVGTLWHWTTGTWHQVTVPSDLSTSSLVTAIWGVDAAHVYIGGSLGFGEWNGATLTTTMTGLVQVNAIHGASATDIVVVGSGLALRYDGLAWDDVSSPRSFRAVWDGGGVVYAGLDVGASFLRNASWEPVASTDGTSRVWAGAGIVLAIGEDELVERDSTGAWTDIQDLPQNGDDVWGFDANDFWYATTNTVQHFDGAWHDVTNNLTALGITSLLNSIWGSSSTDIWACDANALFHWTGATWTKTSPGYPTVAVRGSSATDIWAVTGTNIILHYDGMSWTPMTVGAALESIYVVSSQLAFAGGGNGVVARWDGTLWHVEQTASLGTITSVWAGAQTDAFASDNHGAYWHYDGTQWTPIRGDGQYAETGGIAGDADHIYFGGEDGVLPLYRHTVW